MNRCPDCRNLFVQPFTCTTCGAQKLYDETVRSLHGRCETLEARLALARHALTEIRLRLHAVGRRPEECYEMSLIDDVLAQEPPR